MPSPSSRAFTALLLAGVLGLSVAACGDDGGGSATATGGQAAGGETPREASGGKTSAEATREIAGGVTKLRLADSLTTVLGVAGIDIEPIGGAKRVDGALQFPIERGEIDVDAASGSLQHRGGLRLSVAGRQLEATDLVVDPGKGVLTAEVGGRRVPFLALDMGQPEAPGNAVVWPASAGLSAEAARSINDRLGIDVLRSGLSAGDVTIDARRP